MLREVLRSAQDDKAVFRRVVSKTTRVIPSRGDAAGPRKDGLITQFSLRAAHFDCEVLRSAQDDKAVFARDVFKTFRKNGAVRLTRFFATCSGVPQATTSPPA